MRFPLRRFLDAISFLGRSRTRVFALAIGWAILAGGNTSAQPNYPSSVSVTPASGWYVSPIRITFNTAALPGEEIWYTLDGSVPVQGPPSLLYAGPFNLSWSGAVSVKAKVFVPGYIPPTIAVNYVLVAPGPGEYVEVGKNQGQMVADASSFKSTALPGAVIDNNLNSAWQTAANPPPGPWLRVDFGAGMERSVGRLGYVPPSNFRYTVEAFRIYVTSDSTANPAAWGPPVAEGTFACCVEQEVTFPAKEGRFVILQALSSRLDGQVYTPGQPRVGELKVFVTAGGAPPPAQAPLFRFPSGIEAMPGTYADPLRLILASGTPDAEIWYTIDGSEPVQGPPSLLANGPVDLIGLGAVTLKAKSFHSYFSPSPTSTREYLLGPEPGQYTRVGERQMSATASSNPDLANGAVYNSSIDWISDSDSNGIGEWLRVDFGEGIERNIGKLRLFIGVVGITFRVFVTSSTSTDSADWGAPLTDWTEPLVGDTVQFPPKVGRFLILQCVFSPLDHARINIVHVFQANSDVPPPLEAPRLFPASGTYNSPIEFSLYHSAPDAGETWITYDGTEPGQGPPSELYEGPVLLDSVGVFEMRAKTFAPSMNPSPTASATYTISLPVTATPKMFPVGGAYTTPLSLSMNCTTPGADIWYTLDGTSPVQGAPSLLYSGAFDLTGTGTRTVKARAFAPGYDPSPIATEIYTLSLPVTATPQITPASGAYSSPLNATITCATPSAAIWYTLNGAEPVPGPPSLLYSGSVQVTGSGAKTLKAKAFASGYGPSATASATYNLTMPTVATPQFSPTGGTFAGSVNVTMTCATAGAEIWYAIGSYPVQGPPSIRYTGPVNISSTSVVKARAFSVGMTASAVRQGNYTITP